MSTAAEFFQTIDGVPTPQQASQLLELMQGETSLELEAGRPEPEPEAKEPVVEQPEEMTAENTVILARDGKHTISFDELKDAREGKRAAETALATANAEIETLRQAAQARADAGLAPTQADANLVTAQAAIDQGVDPAIFGDFSEEAMAKGIETLIERRFAVRIAEMDAKLAEAEAKVAKALEPIVKREAESAEDAYYKPVYDAHPDARSVFGSVEFNAWFDAQPGFVQKGIDLAMDSGDVPEIIKIFDTYKSDTGKTQSAQPDVKAAAAKAIAEAKAPTPSSLSDFPGGKTGVLGKAEILATKSSGADMLGIMEDMTPEQINDWLDRTL